MSASSTLFPEEDPTAIPERVAISIVGLEPTMFDCSTKEDEYWSHVSSQAELPIADGALPNDLVDDLNDLADLQHEDRTYEQLVEDIGDKLLEQPELLSQLRLLVALSDKRVYLDLSYILSRIASATHPDATLCGCTPSKLTKHGTAFFERVLGSGANRVQTSRVIADYLLRKGLAEMLALYGSLNPELRETLVQTLIMPSEYQQNEAKRRGHGAEAAVASVLQQVGCEFVPANKITNPMGSHDPNIDLATMTIVPREAGQTISCDLVVLDDDGKPRMLVQGLIQSSDPGQFGVNKSDESVAIRGRLDTYNSTTEAPVELWGIIDGVGYCENKNGTVNKMLRAFHGFVQIKSLYKVALGAHRLGLCHLVAIAFDPAHYSEETASQMAERYVPEDLVVVPFGATFNTAVAVSAGNAVVYALIGD